MGIVSNIVGLKSLKTRLFLYFVLILVLLRVGVVILVKLTDTSFDSIQKILFFVSILALFFISRKFKFFIPTYVFIFAVAFWIAVSFRIPLMLRAGYFSNRIVLGSFETDIYSLNAREVYQELRKIGLTYKLPGPLVLPLSRNKFEINNLNFNSDRDKWLNSLVSPALLIFSKNDSYEVNFPNIKIFPELEVKLKKENFASKSGVLNKDKYEFLKIDGFSSPLMMPELPAKVVIPKDPPQVIYHYISWLSGFFHSEIRNSPHLVIDALNEAASILGPWKNQIPKVVSRYLFSLQEFSMWHEDITDAEIDILRQRLFRAKQGLVSSPQKELEVRIKILDAICLLSMRGDSVSHKKAFLILENILIDSSIPDSQKIPVLYNIAVLLDEGFYWNF